MLLRVLACCLMLYLPDVDLSFLDEFPDVAAEMRQFFTLPRKKKAINRLHKGWLQYL